MSIVIPVMRTICSECLICHWILYLHNSDGTSVQGAGEENKRRPQMIHSNMQTRTHQTLEPSSTIICTEIIQLYKYMFAYVCSPSVSYPSHTHRETLKANQKLKGFSLGQKEIDWCAGTTDCIAALPSNYHWSTTCPQSHCSSRATAHKTCFHSCALTSTGSITVMNPSLSLFKQHLFERFMFKYAADAL